MAKIKKRFNRVSARHHSVPPDDGLDFLDAVESNDKNGIEIYVGKYGQEGLEVCARDWLADGNGDSRTALMIAVQNGSAKTAEALIQLGANVNATTHDGFPVLMLSDSPALSALLLDNGAQLDAQNKSGCTALMAARSNDMLEFLLSRGAKVDVRDHGGGTALSHLAELAHCFRGALDKGLDALIGAGAEVDGVDNNGRTALFGAAASSSYGGQAALASARHLLERGASPDVRDVDGRNVSEYVRAKISASPAKNAEEKPEPPIFDILEQASAAHAERSRKAFVEGAEQGVGVMKPLQLKR